MKVKIFTNNISHSMDETSATPGLKLTKQIDDWIKTLDGDIQILSAKTTTIPGSEMSYAFIITTIIYKLNEIKNFKVE